MAIQYHAGKTREYPQGGDDHPYQSDTSQSGRYRLDGHSRVAIALATVDTPTCGWQARAARKAKMLHGCKCFWDLGGSLGASICESTPSLACFVMTSLLYGQLSGA